MTNSFFESGSPLDRANPHAEITSFDRKVYESLQKVLLLPNDFKEYMTQYQALNGVPIPISQITGFAQFAPQPATDVTTNESTTSTTYTNLATTGPSLSGLSNGRYMILFGCALKHSAGAGNASLMSVSVNGAAPGASEHCSSEMTGYVSVNRALFKSLTAGANTISCQYRVTAGTGDFANRWLAAIRYANI